MKSIFKLIYIYVFAIVVTSCGSAKIVSKDIVKGDVIALIQDNTKYPQSREQITKYLTNDVDYSKKSYQELVTYRSFAKDDPILFENYSSLVEMRENTIIESLYDMDIKEIASYYIQHRDEHVFLKPFLYDSYVDALESLPYQTAKKVNMEFANTDLGKDIYNALINYRNKIYPYANIFGEEYEDAVFAKLSNMNLHEVATYYKDNVRDRMFLTPVLRRVYLDNDSISYPEIKVLFSEFNGTEFGRVIKTQYDSLRTVAYPFVIKGVAEYLNDEKEIIQAYKSYARESAMTYLAESSGSIIADFITPSVGEVIEVICGNPQQFAKDVATGMWDGAVNTAKSLWDVVTFKKSVSEAFVEEKKESAEAIFAKAYRDNISEDDVIKTIFQCSNELSNTIIQARTQFAQDMTDVKNTTITQFDVVRTNSERFDEKCDISELKDIVNNKNKDDTLGTAIAIGSYCPVVGDALMIVETIYSLDKYNEEVEFTKNKLDVFQNKLNDFFMQMVDYYIDSFFSPIEKQIQSSSDNFKLYIYENY